VGVLVSEKNTLYLPAGHAVQGTLPVKPAEQVAMHASEDVLPFSEKGVAVGHAVQLLPFGP